MSVEGRVVFITGAGRGIGRALAIGFSREGARVAVGSTTMSRNVAVADEITAQGGEALPIRLDVAVPEDVAAAVDQTVRRFGRVDILINNAALRGESLPSGSREVADMPVHLWRRMIDVNLVGPYLCSRECLKLMVPQRRGSIVNLPSYAPMRVRPGLSAYAASKAGLITLTKVLALEVQEQNIAVNAILPGFTATGTREQWTGRDGEILRPDTSLPLALSLADQDPVRVTGELIDAMEWNEQNGFGPKRRWLYSFP